MSVEGGGPRLEGLSSGGRCVVYRASLTAGITILFWSFERREKKKEFHMADSLEVAGL